MNARACQLCGKPLSRIWVGSGGDFCSREHRNQYRLRRGMDRLQEESKVASLMRRRENPKALPFARLAGAYAVAQRGFFQGRIPSSQRELGALPQSRPILAASLSPKAENYLAPRPVRPEGRPARTAEGRPGLLFHTGEPTLPVRRWNPAVALAQARFATSRDRVFGAEGRRREFGILRHPILRLHFDRGAIPLDPAGPPALSYLRKPRPARTVRLSPKRGNALRVSSRLAFGLPAGRTRRLHLRPPLGGLTWPNRPHAIVPGARRHEAGPRSLGTAVSGPGLRYPTAPKPRTAASFRWPGARPLANRAHYGATAGPRAALRDRLHHAGGLHLRRLAAAAPDVFPEADAVRLFSLPGRPVSQSGGAAPAQRLEVARFVPQDAPFGLVQFVIDGSLSTWASTAPGATAAPPKPAEKPQAVPSAPITMEDHFDAGMSHWMGEVSDWKLDVAGVRTGALALYTPSLEMSDYDLQFLARIEHRSVTWVFRAWNLTEYYMATIAVTPDGYELTRRAVGVPPVEGISEPVTVPVRLAHASKTAITVGTRVKGDEFAISIDGQTVDAWTDARLPIGGIGLLGAPDDRARLYWVRISTNESSSKEYRRK